MPRTSKTEKADTPAKPTKPAKAPDKDQKLLWFGHFSILETHSFAKARRRSA